MFRSPSDKSALSSSQSGSSFKRTFKTSFTGSISGKSTASELSIEGEAPIGLLRVQVVSCRHLPAADFNDGRPDPYVVITFGNQRVKTPVVKKNPYPTYLAKEATFDLPVFSSVIGTRGALLDFVVWDKDVVGKDYLGECSLSPSQWYKSKDGPNDAPVYAFDDAGNNPLSFPLISSKPWKSHRGHTTMQPKIQIKIGLVPLNSGTQDLQAVYEEIVAKASEATDKLLSVPPLQAIGALRQLPSSISETARKNNKGFVISWRGECIDYDFASNSSIMGIILLEVTSANDLPKIKNLTRTSFDMDPYIVIEYNDDLFRTRVIRHDSDPFFDNRFILFVRPSGGFSHVTGAVPGIEAPTVILSILDWGQLSKNKHVGTAVMDIQPLIDAAPKPDPETWLYSPEAMRLHAFSEVSLEVCVAQSEKWEGKATPTIFVKAKYNPNAALRQHGWRLNLKSLDKEYTGQLSHSELLMTLKGTGLPVLTEHVDGFFAELNKNPETDELTIEEAMICLEKEYGAGAQMKAEEEAAALTDKEPEADTSISGNAPASASGAPSAAGSAPPNAAAPAPPTRPTPRPARSSMLDHSREAIYDQQLRHIFRDHPQAYYLSEEDQKNGDAVVPTSALLSNLETFSKMNDAEPLEPDDKTTLQSLVQGMDGQHIGPEFLITLLAKATGTAGETSGGLSLESSTYITPAPDDDELDSNFRERFSSESTTVFSTTMFSSTTTASGDRYEDSVKTLKTLDQKMVGCQSDRGVFLQMVNASTGEHVGQGQAIGSSEAYHSLPSINFGEHDSQRRTIETVQPAWTDVKLLRTLDFPALRDALTGVATIGPLRVRGLALRGEDGAIFCDLLQQCLSNIPEAGACHPMLLRLLQDVCYASGELPSSYWLHGVTVNWRRCIGRGGEALVYLGAYGGEKVVVRNLQNSGPTSSSFPQDTLAHVRREIVTHAQLRHPNIIPLLGVFRDSDDEAPMMILPFVENGSAVEYLSGATFGDIRDLTWNIILGLGRALAYLHGRKPPVLHGDLHPGNVLVDAKGEAILCDFGFSRIRHEVTRTFTMIREGGRLRFLAPELSFGHLAFRTATSSDVYSLAMTFFNLITLSMPFLEHQSEIKAVNAAEGGARPQRPESHNLHPRTAGVMWKLIEKMWDHVPENRPSALDVQMHMEGIIRPLA